jgi:hypothetical protein
MAAAATVAAREARRNPSMRILMNSAHGKTRTVLWGTTKTGEDAADSADLVPRIPSREGNILLDETLEMRLNGVVAVVVLNVSYLRLVTLSLCSRVGKAEELCALTQGCILL